MKQTWTDKTSTDIRCIHDSNGDRDCHLCAKLGGCQNFKSNWIIPATLPEVPPDKTPSFKFISHFDVKIGNPRQNIIFRADD